MRCCTSRTTDGAERCRLVPSGVVGRQNSRAPLGLTAVHFRTSVRPRTGVTSDDAARVKKVELDVWGVATGRRGFQVHIRPGCAISITGSQILGWSYSYAVGAIGSLSGLTKLPALRVAEERSGDA